MESIRREEWRRTILAKKGKSESQRELGAYFKFPPVERTLRIRYLRFKLWSLQTSADQLILGKKGRRRKAKKYNGGSFQCVLTPDRSDQYSRQGDLKFTTQNNIRTNITEGYFHNLDLDLKWYFYCWYTYTLSLLPILSRQELSNYDLKSNLLSP